MTKRTLLSLVLCLGLCLPAFAKSKPDSQWQRLLKQLNVHGQAIRSGFAHAKKSQKNQYVITTLNWSNGTSDYTDSSDKVVLSYNPDSSLDMVTILSYSNPATKLVIDSFRQMSGGEEFNEFDFLGDMLPVKAKAYIKSGGNWVLSQQYSYTYTSRGLEQVLTQKWNGTAWENDEMEYYLFDTHDMPLGYLYQKWVSGDWSNIAGERVDYTYDGDDLPIEGVFTEMKNGATDWSTPTDGIVKETYFNNIYEEVGSAIIDWADGSRDSVGGITWHTYKAEENGILSLGGTQYEELTIYTWDNTSGMWVLVSHNTKSYNTSDMEMEEVVQLWDENTSAWVNDSRVTHDYNTDGTVKERLEYNWNGGQWVLNYGERYTNNYDTDGDPLTSLYDTYDGTNWVKNTKTIYSYTAPVGINERTKIASVNMYPNPVSDKLIVTLNTEGKNSTISIFALSGQLVSQVTTAQNRLVIGTESLNAGTYILRVQSGNSLQTGRFVKR